MFDISVNKQHYEAFCCEGVKKTGGHAQIGLTQGPQTKPEILISTNLKFEHI